jgi:hypothetical protein
MEPWGLLGALRGAPALKGPSVKLLEAFQKARRTSRRPSRRHSGGPFERAFLEGILKGLYKALKGPYKALNGRGNNNILEEAFLEGHAALRPLNIYKYYAPS